jgi:hypothetical protein
MLKLRHEAGGGADHYQCIQRHSPAAQKVHEVS